jgi:hypothetical protein
MTAECDFKGYNNKYMHGGKMDGMKSAWDRNFENWSINGCSISSENVIVAYKKSKIVPEVKQLIFREDSKTTIVIWKDNTKTVVKSNGDEDFIPEVGFAEALAKKIYGSRNAFLRVVENAYHQPVRIDKQNKEIHHKRQENSSIDEQNTYE